MIRKPTYKELEKKIAVLEKKIAELEGSKKAIQRSEERLKEAERIKDRTLGIGFGYKYFILVGRNLSYF